MGVEKVRTTPYRASTNGHIERLHRTLNGMLARIIRPDWCTWLPGVMDAYRSTPHESTGPNALKFGRENYMLVDLVLGDHSGDARPFDSEDDYVNELQGRLRETFHLVRQHLGKTATRRKEQSDVKVNPTTLPKEIGYGTFVPGSMQVCRQNGRNGIAVLI